MVAAGSQRLADLQTGQLERSDAVSAYCLRPKAARLLAPAPPLSASTAAETANEPEVITRQPQPFEAWRCAMKGRIAAAITYPSCANGIHYSRAAI